MKTRSERIDAIATKVTRMGEELNELDEKWDRLGVPRMGNAGNAGNAP